MYLVSLQEAAQYLSRNRFVLCILFSHSQRLYFPINSSKVCSTYWNNILHINLEWFIIFIENSKLRNGLCYCLIGLRNTLKCTYFKNIDLHACLRETRNLNLLSFLSNICTELLRQVEIRAFSRFCVSKYKFSLSFDWPFPIYPSL